MPVAMPAVVTLRRALCHGAAAWAACAALAPAGLHAATGFPALQRPALQVRAPQRQVLQAAAQAGPRIVAVGERGLVVLSDDGGKTWRQARQVPVSVSLTALAFVDAKVGWAVGHGGAILSTADGGDTWVKQADGFDLAKAALAQAEQAAAQRPADPVAARALEDARRLADDGATRPLLDVRFVDARRGWVVGAYNLFFETTDGGANWRSVGDRLDNPKALHLNALAVHGRTLVIAGEQGVLYRSVDGGQSFQSLASPYKGSWFSVALGSDTAVTVGGLRGNALRSMDAGKTWSAIEGLPPVSIVAVAPWGEGGVLLSNQAGQLFVVRSNAKAEPLRVPPMPPLNGSLRVGDQALIALGFGGVIALDLSGAPK